MLEDIAGPSDIESAIDELEELSAGAGSLSVAALHVLKNELGPRDSALPPQKIVDESSFVLPRPLLAELRLQIRAKGARAALRTFLRERGAWLRGADSRLFRDRCDAAFWADVVPEVVESYGALAEPVLNTINEAIINYAEYSFGPWSIGRRIQLHLFRTSDDLAYAILRPSGGRLRAFDPLALRNRGREGHTLLRRGWGHTLILERALFLSFDHEPRRRGMLVVIGPDRG